METQERRIALFQELSTLIGPIVERETSKRLNRAIDVVDALITIIVEISRIFFDLTPEDGKEIFNNFRQDIITRIRKKKEKTDVTIEEGDGNGDDTA